MNSVFLLTFLFSLSLVAAEKNLYGKVYDQREEKILYHEVHRIVTDDKGFVQLIETRFLDNNLKEFGSLRSDFRKNLLVPNVELTDSRFKRKEKLSVAGDEAEIAVTVDGQTPRKKTVAIGADSVGGQGLSNFILKHLDELLAGKEKKIALIMMQIMDYFNFEAVRINATPKEQVVSLKLVASSFFMKAFAKPIAVKFDRETKTLTEYRGQSNLNNDKNEKQEVVIKYSESPPISP